MAAGRPTRTTSGKKVNKRNTRGMYVDGNAVRKLQEAPERRTPQRRTARKVEESSKRVRSASESREIQRQIERNRAKAAGMNRGFIVFLTIICIALLTVTIQYLQLKSQITTCQKNVAVFESQLTKLREENDAYQSQITNNVDMNKVRQIAIGRLGMRYPSEDQTETYQTARSSYVRQYQDLPDSK